jgi:hypothetical protein
MATAEVLYEKLGKPKQPQFRQTGALIQITSQMLSIKMHDMLCNLSVQRK